MTSTDNIGRRPVLLSILPGYCDKFVPECETGNLPPTLSSLFNEEFLEMSYLDLLKKCEESFFSITVTQQQAKHLEKVTRSQADSKMWFQYRASCVTASKFKAAAHTNKSSPSQSLIKTICYPESHKFTSEATQWGCTHEESARDAFFRNSKDHHANLKIERCGLVVNPCYPHLGACLMV